MLAALLTAAQAEKLLTVRDVQAMLTDAGCPESSRGHAHSLMVGACQPTPHEFMAIVSHLGCEMLAYAAARAAGGSYAPVTATRAEPMASAIAAIGDAHALVSDLHAAMADGVVTQIEHARLERAATTLRDDAARVAGAVDALVVGGAK